MVHDPDSKLIKPYWSEFLQIAHLFDRAIVEVTPESGGYYDACNYTYVHAADNLGNARRRVLEKGIETSCDVLFFCDFDRLLFWWLMYPNELKIHIANLSKDNLVIFGRTKSAMDTHPTIQRETERLCNLLFCHEFSDYDILAACRSIPREIAIDILEESIATNPACIDAEWPTIAGWDNLEYAEVNGLGYESDLFDIAKSWEDEIQMRVENLSELTRWLIKH